MASFDIFAASAALDTLKTNVKAAHDANQALALKKIEIEQNTPLGFRPVFGTGPLGELTVKMTPYDNPLEDKRVQFRVMEAQFEQAAQLQRFRAQSAEQQRIKEKEQKDERARTSFVGAMNALSKLPGELKLAPSETDRVKRLRDLMPFLSLAGAEVQGTPFEPLLQTFLGTVTAQVPETTLQAAFGKPNVAGAGLPPQTAPIPGAVPTAAGVKASRGATTPILDSITVFPEFLDKAKAQGFEGDEARLFGAIEQISAQVEAGFLTEPSGRAQIQRLTEESRAITKAEGKEDDLTFSKFVNDLQAKRVAGQDLFAQVQQEFGGTAPDVRKGSAENVLKVKQAINRFVGKDFSELSPRKQEAVRNEFVSSPLGQTIRAQVQEVIKEADGQIGGKVLTLQYEPVVKFQKDRRVIQKDRFVIAGNEMNPEQIRALAGYAQLVLPEAPESIRLVSVQAQPSQFGGFPVVPLGRPRTEVGPTLIFKAL